MRKISLILICLFFNFLIFASGRDVDVSIGFGHLWSGNGNYLYGSDTRDFDFAIASKYSLSPQYSIYAGYTRDAVETMYWLEEHNFVKKSTPKIRFEFFDIGLLYNKACDGVDVFAGGGTSLCKSTETKTATYFLLMGCDIKIYKNFFVTLKTQYRRAFRDSDFAFLNSAKIETGLLLTYRF